MFLSFVCVFDFRRDPLSARPFEGLKFIDVGCGGGILSEVLLYIILCSASMQMPSFGLVI